MKRYKERGEEGEKQYRNDDDRVTETQRLYGCHRHEQRKSPLCQ